MGYKVAFKEHIESNYKWTVEVMQKPESTTGFIPQKNRWQVERSFGWLNFRRRMFKDVEKTIFSSEAMTQIAFISLIINRYNSKTNSYKKYLYISHLKIIIYF